MSNKQKKNAQKLYVELIRKNGTGRMKYDTKLLQTIFIKKMFTSWKIYVENVALILILKMGPTDGS